MSERLDIQTEQVLVTGASSGLGEVVAETFATAGHEVFMTGRDADRTAAVADRLGVEHVLADLGREHEARYAVDEAVTALGGLSVVVNCAGGKALDQRTGSGRIQDLDPEQIDDMVGANVTGLYKLTQAAHGPLARTAAGRRSQDPARLKGAVFINVGSSAYHQPSEQNPGYGAGAADQADFMDDVRLDWSRHSGIGVTNIDLGALASDMRAGRPDKPARSGALALGAVAGEIMRLATDRSNIVTSRLTIHDLGYFDGTEPPRMPPRR